MILAIRTDSEQAEIYLLDQGGQVISEKVWQAGHELSKTILSEIVKLLKSQKQQLKNLTAVVVYQGPGSFTSLRIGISVANTLAYSNNIQVVGSGGKDWIKQGVKLLPTASVGKYVIPHYGRQPNITKPRK